jgi:hypothetical protein
MTEHTIPEPVRAYPVFAVYAHFDHMAPDSEDLIVVADEDLALEVCKELNRNTRDHSDLACVEGLEYLKVFRYRPTLRVNTDEIRTCLKDCPIGNPDEEDDES